MEVLGSLFIGIMAIIYNAFAYGLAIDFYWDWFIVANSTAIGGISYATGIGIYMLFILIKFLLGTDEITTDTKDREVSSIIASFLATPWLVMLFGYFMSFLIGLL